MSPILEVEGLSKRFGKVVTADDVTFSVERGTALGIVGPNGAGKSTLLSLIGGVLPPDAGAIRFDGKDITRLPAGARSTLGIARSFQIPRPFVDMTVFENVFVGAAFGGKTGGQAGYDQAAEALEIAGLTHLANVPAGQLRLLDRKRLELARALATEPSLILLDEIAGGLTEKELPPLIELIRGLRDSGVTVIWIRTRSWRAPRSSRSISARRSTWARLRHDLPVGHRARRPLRRLPGDLLPRPHHRRGRDAGGDRCQRRREVHASQGHRRARPGDRRRH
jgi:branched-chain amino acid transport system ATP-binding protein